MHVWVSVKLFVLKKDEGFVKVVQKDCRFKNCIMFNLITMFSIVPIPFPTPMSQTNCYRLTACMKIVPSFQLLVPKRREKFHIRFLKHLVILHKIHYINEPPRGKINNVVSEQVLHKPTCTSTEKS